MADAVLIDAKKLDEDAYLFSILANPNHRFLVIGKLARGKTNRGAGARRGRLF